MVESVVEHVLNDTKGEHTRMCVCIQMRQAHPKRSTARPRNGESTAEMVYGMDITCSFVCLCSRVGPRHKAVVGDRMGLGKMDRLFPLRLNSINPTKTKTYPPDPPA